MAKLAAKGSVLITTVKKQVQQPKSIQPFPHFMGVFECFPDLNWTTQSQNGGTFSDTGDVLTFSITTQPLCSCCDGVYIPSIHVDFTGITLVSSLAGQPVTGSLNHSTDLDISIPNRPCEYRGTFEWVQVGDDTSSYVEVIVNLSLHVTEIRIYSPIYLPATYYSHSGFSADCSGGVFSGVSEDQGQVEITIP